MKKEKKQEIFPWKKVFVIAVGVLFVAMMVLSAMGSSWLSSFRSVMANDSVTIGFTLRDSAGQPVLTTDQGLYQSSLGHGYLTFYTKPLTVRAGHTGNPPTTGVDAENYYVSQTEPVRFGILGQELDEMDIAVLGMKAGDTKTIRFAYADSLILSMTKNEFTAMGGNFTNSAVGDLIPIGISETPVVEGLNQNDTTPTNPVLRIATVINKTADSIEVEHRYPTADITVSEFK
ncbi:MAG TPA: hypothetical protein VMB35_03920 [Methanomicrobiales archaeon]|nr:hypothetical protein [Methanomicrobiales archaeon]